MERDENTKIDLLGWLCFLGIAALILVLFLLATRYPVSAATATVTWNANTEPDLAAYQLYRSNFPCTQVGPLAPLLDATGKPVAVPKGTTSYVDTVADGTYCYEVTASDLKNNISGRSKRAEVLVDTNPPSPPQNLVVTVGL
jgi:hypothetical protein